eukprot:gene15727-21848_t
MGLLVTPATIEFSDMHEGDVQSAIISIKNVKTKGCSLRIRPPKGQFFSIRGFVPGQRLAPGFECSFEVIFDATKGPLKEFTQDMLTVQSDFGDQTVSLKAMIPMAFLEVMGDLHFGVLPTDSKALKKLKVFNRGKAAASFTIEWDKALPLTIEPTAGELQPGESTEISAHLTIQDLLPGPLGGDMTVLLGDGKITDQNRKLIISASVIKTSLEMMDPNGILITDVQFGQNYFGETLTRQVFIYNNAPTDASFLLSYGSAGEMKGRGIGGEENGASAGGDPDDPYAGFVNAARQKVRARATNDNPFTVSPQSGTLKPYSKIPITVVFTPQGLPNAKGFASESLSPEDQARLFDYLVLLEFSGGCNKKLRLPIKGKGYPGGLRLDPMSLDFGNVASQSHVDHLVNLLNTSSKTIDFKRGAHQGALVRGAVNAASRAILAQGHGTAHGDAAHPCYCAWSQGFGAEARANGSSLSKPASKEPLVGWIDKLPADFTKAIAYADGEQILQSKTALTQKTAKATTKIWEREEAQDSFQAIGDGTVHAMGKNAYIAKDEHREKYIDTMRARRTNSKAEAERKLAAEDDVNLDVHIHIVMDLKSIPELRGSKNTSQVIPAGCKAKFPLTLTTTDVREVSEKVEYCLNSTQLLDFQVSASIVPVGVDISTEEMHFAFALDNWNNSVDKTLVINNPHKFPIEYTLESTHEAFSVSQEKGVLKPQTSVEILVKWAPPLDGSASGLQQGHVVMNLLGGEAPRRIFVQGQLPEGSLKLKEKTCDFYIKNTGSRDSAFKIEPPAGVMLTIKPLSDRISADEGRDIEVEFTCLEAGPLNCVIETLKLPFKAEGMLPHVDLLQEDFDFGNVYIGNSAKQIFTLSNTTPVPALVCIDLLHHPEFQIELPKDSWNPAEHDAPPLTRLGGAGVAAGGLGSIGGSRLMSRKESRRASSCSHGYGGSAEGARFHISLRPNKSLDLLLAFRPTAIEASEANILSTGAKQQADPVIRSVKGQGVQPKIVLSKTSVNFGERFVIRSNQNKMPYSTDIYVTNADSDGLPVKVSFGAPVFVAESDSRPKISESGHHKGSAAFKAGANDGVFTFDPPALTVGTGEMVGSRLSFTPREDKTYEATVPVYVDGDTTSAYLQIEIVGTGENARLTFDLRECVLPPTPLGITSTATFYILNHGYDNLDLRYRLPADESHVPMSISFPEGNLIGIAKERLPVTVSFTSNKPLSFTANVDFMDEEGKRFSLPISGTTDNCGIEGTPIMLEEDEANPFTLPVGPALLGPTQGSANMCRFLNATTNKGPYTDIAVQMVSSRGKMIVELVEVLGGKPFPGKIAKLPPNKKEAAEMLLRMFDALLVFLKGHGALLNAVKPEMLLDAEDLARVLTGRSNKAVKPEELDALDKWDALEEQFDLISTQAWNSVVTQVFKVFVLGRVTLKSFKTLPGISELEALMPPDANIIGSNLYSVSESVLLAWMTMHYSRAFPDIAQRVTNFDEDLKSGLVVFSLLSGYWPALGSRKDVLHTTPTSEADFLDNNELVVRLMSEMGISIDVPAADLSTPKALEMLMLVLYLYQVLPQFVPKTTIELTSRLGELAVKELELTNPSKKAISYTTKDFSTEVNIVHIDAKSTVRLPVKCLPTISLPQESRLVLMSRKDGGANAATLVFLLKSQIKTRSPLKRIRTEGPLYEMQHFEFQVVNPYPEDCEFAITLLHEQAEPPVKEEPDTKRRGGMAPSRPKKEDDKSSNTPPKELFPNAFGLDRNRLRLKKNASEKMKAFFLPFAMGQHFCTLCMKKNASEKIKALRHSSCPLPWASTSAPDKEQGEFVYELVGDTTLPAPNMEIRALLPLEGPALFDVVLPFANNNLESAKRMFLEKHPLGKDKEQTALLKSDIFGTPEIEYTVTQTNSLINCAKSVVVTVMMDAKKAAAAPGGQKSSQNGSEMGPAQTKSLMMTDAKKATAAPGGQKSSQNGSEMGPAQCINPASEVPQNGLRLTLKPIGTGIYPSRLLLTSNIDTRVIDLELMAQTLTQNFQLEFSIACRQQMSQDVPLVNTSDRMMAGRQQMSQDVTLVNTSDRMMAVVAKIDGPCWTGVKEVSVPAGATISYSLTFKPTTPGDQKGTLELCIPATGEKNIYALVGRVTEPLAEGNIVIQCKARTSVSRAIAVPNLIGAAVSYNVMCDLDFVSGPEKCKSASSQGTTYKMSVTPPFSGKYYGSISFVTDDGATVWYSLEANVEEPPEVGCIDVSATVLEAMAVSCIALTTPTTVTTTPQVREAMAVSCIALTTPTTVTTIPQVREAMAVNINVVNPMDEECEMTVVYSDDSLIGPSSLTLPAGSREALGEFWYLLKMHADPASRTTLPEMTAAVGFRSFTTIKVENPLSKAKTMTLASSNKQNFIIRPSEITLPPWGSSDVKLEYVPSSLDEEEEAVVTVGSEESGMWEYYVTGHGTMPEAMDTTSLSAKLAATAHTNVVWRNPFPKPVQIQLSLKPTNEAGESALTLLARKKEGLISIPGFGETQISIGYSPSSLRNATADLMVTSSRESIAATTADGQSLVWRYPIRGLPEMNQDLGSMFSYKCRARAVAEERMEILLTGLASVDVGEEFQHELIIPPEYLEFLGDGVLEITPVESRLKGTNTPLVYALHFAPKRMFDAEVSFVAMKASGGRWCFEVQLQATEPELDSTLTIESTLDQTSKVMKASGGRWCFEVQLQATEPELDGTLTIESTMDQTSKVPVYLYSTTSEPQAFTAGFTADTPLNFDVTPSRGILPPMLQEGEAPSGPPVLEVSYTCKDMGKVMKGRLYVQTSDMQYSYDLKGKMPEYQPPHPSQFEPTVDSRLSPEMQAKLDQATNPKKGRPNFVAMNTKASKSRPSTREKR